MLSNLSDDARFQLGQILARVGVHPQETDKIVDQVISAIDANEYRIPSGVQASSAGQDFDETFDRLTEDILRSWSAEGLKVVLVALAGPAAYAAYYIAIAAGLTSGLALAAAAIVGVVLMLLLFPSTIANIREQYKRALSDIEEAISSFSLSF